MNLDDAILHARHQSCQGGECGAEHDQLAMWLEELRNLRAEQARRHGESKEAVLEVLENAEAWTADGFEDALVGYADVAQRTIAVYDYESCVEILMSRDGMTREGAEEFIEFNVIGADVGKGTPAFATLIK